MAAPALTGKKRQREAEAGPGAEAGPKAGVASAMLAKLRPHTQCAICQEAFKKTQISVKCMHRFCGECIKRAMAINDSNCPICRAKFPSRRWLRPDPAMDRLVELLYGDAEAYEEEEHRRVQRAVEENQVRFQQLVQGRNAQKLREEHILFFIQPKPGTRLAPLDMPWIKIKLLQPCSMGHVISAIKTYQLQKNPESMQADEGVALFISEKLDDTPQPDGARPRTNINRLRGEESILHEIHGKDDYFKDERGARYLWFSSVLEEDGSAAPAAQEIAAAPNAPAAGEDAPAAGEDAPAAGDAPVPVPVPKPDQ